MSEFDFPVFDGLTGKMLGNQTSIQGVTNAIPSIASLPPLPPIPGVQTASNVSPGQTTGQPTAPATSTPTDAISQYFVRAVVIILGFIFVAVGLTLFGAKTAVGQNVIREVRNSVPRP